MRSHSGQAFLAPAGEIRFNTRHRALAISPLLIERRGGVCEGGGKGEKRKQGGQKQVSCRDPGWLAA